MRLTLDARTAAFGGLIDYAGLFPPASLPVADAVGEYRDLRTSLHRWVGGRFLCRASDLEEIAAVAVRGFERGESPWEIGMIVDMSPGAAASLGQAFQRELSPIMSITAVEARLSGPAVTDAGMLLDAIATIDRDTAAFLEIDPAGSTRKQIHEIGEAIRDRGMRGGAKLRCGGETRDRFPDVDQVATFIWEATLASLPFKATAGLHQPIRHHDDALDVWRHGFLNILMASAACDAGEDHSIVEAIIAESDPTAFSVSAMTASWRTVSLPGSAIRRSRQSGFVAFGSCDLEEPLTALDDLGFLGEGS
jgi:hypothetical protein